MAKENKTKYVILGLLAKKSMLMINYWKWI